MVTWKRQLVQAKDSKTWTESALGFMGSARQSLMPSGPASLIALVLVFAGMVEGCAPAKESSVSILIQPELFLSSRELQLSSRASRDPVRSALFNSERVILISGTGEEKKTSHRSASQRSVQSEDGDLTPSVSCVGLNVMGVNISSALGSEGSSAWKQYKKDVLNGDSCSYPGKVSNLVSVDTGGEITVQVPFGSDRVIQLLGYSGTDCNQSMSASSLADTESVPGAYELGRSVSDLFSSAPSLELEFDLATLTNIETNEESETVDEFVPDIRCQLKGEPQEQFEDLKAAAELISPSPSASATPEPSPSPSASASPSPSPSPSASASPDPGPSLTPTCSAGQYLVSDSCVNVGVGFWSDGTSNDRTACGNAPGDASYTSATATSSNCPWACNTGYVPEAGGCISYPGAVTSSCLSGEVVVGASVKVFQGAVTKVKVKCQAMASSALTGTASFAFEIGQSNNGAQNNRSCSTNEAVVAVVGTNGAKGDSSTTLSQRYDCQNLTGGDVVTGSSVGNGGGIAYSYSCPAGQFMYGLLVDQGDTSYIGYTLGIYCR